MIRDAIPRVMRGENLDALEAAAVMQEMMSGAATQSQMAALLVAMRIKGETVDEICGFSRTMRAHVVHIVPPRTRNHIDTCGTGGDALTIDGLACSTFNISTAAAFVAAGAGVPVAKHGNRAMSSKCGSADVLEAAGVPIEAPPEVLAKAIDDIGIAFLFAQKLHPSMRFAAPVRREIGVRTVFNVLGPLTNPAKAERQLIGVWDAEWLRPVGEALGVLGSERAMVVHGIPGLDELSTVGPSQVAEWRDGALRTYTLDAADLGFPAARIEDLKGGDVQQNARTLERILQGEEGFHRDVVLLNAAAALLVADHAADWPEALEGARRSIDAGAAFSKLEALRALDVGEPAP
ncbi:MAG TPA: anthranilate phosphoribosyltransferase [Armatimonadota bacterium]|jgi:anthranilate phosphoribosyltransferase